MGRTTARLGMLVVLGIEMLASLVISSGTVVFLRALQAWFPLTFRTTTERGLAARAGVVDFSPRVWW